MVWGLVHDDRTQRAPGGAAWLALALVVGAVTTLRVIFLMTSPLGLDFEEAQYWVWAQSPGWGYFSKPPMIAWIIAAATGLCGDSEACVRVASPLLHGLTALLVGAIGRDLGGPRAAFWAAVGYALAPGISFSSAFMTTDVPLLFFWALALWSLVRLLRSGHLVWAAAVGLAAGFGMLSKYTMLLFPACLLLHLAVDRKARRAVRPAALAVMAAVGGLVFLPNAAWNLAHGLVTIGHAAALAGARQDYLHPVALIEFFLAQLAVCGPLLFAVLVLRFLVRRPAQDERLTLLWVFSVPVLWLFLVESFVAGAHANWAAPAYVAGVLLVTLYLVEAGRLRIVQASLAIHLAAALALDLSATPAAIALPGGRAIVLAGRLEGWGELGAEVARALRGQAEPVLLTNDRRLLGLLGYYAGVPLARMAMWNPDGRVDNQFELVASLAPGDSRSFLLVSEARDPQAILTRFARMRRLEPLRVRGPGFDRRYWLYALAGFKGY